MFDLTWIHMRRLTARAYNDSSISELSHRASTLYVCPACATLAPSLILSRKLGLMLKVSVPVDLYDSREAGVTGGPQTSVSCTTSVSNGYTQHNIITSHVTAFQT